LEAKVTQTSALGAIPIWIWLILAGVFVGVPLVIICIAVLLRPEGRSGPAGPDGPTGPGGDRLQPEA
jgi:hypothetical protein